jgi:hypothetical protein
VIANQAFFRALASAFNCFVTVIASFANDGVISAFASRHAVTSEMVKLHSRMKFYSFGNRSFKLLNSFQNKHFSFPSFLIEFVISDLIKV